MRIALLVLVPLTLLGCALTRAEIETLGTVIADRAAKTASDAVYAKSVKEGLSPVAAKELADLAGKKAAELAKSLAEKAIPETEGEKRSKTEGAIAGIVMMILQGLSAAGRKG
jgi:hypothetical protein